MQKRKLGSSNLEVSAIGLGFMGQEVSYGLPKDTTIDVGPLRSARYTEPFAMIIAHLAYEGTEGPELAYRFEWFGR